jgi:hypothetical protein
MAEMKDRKEFFMKRKFFSIVEALAVLLMTGLVLAGCLTDSGGSDPTPAEQLAADLNAIEPESAEAAGATVTLKSGIFSPQGNQPKIDITVPAGVTLDLTSDDATLGLGPLMNFTVNGVVNVPGGGTLRFEDTASQATIKGSGTIRLVSKGTLIRIESNKNVATQTLILDGVTLDGLTQGGADGDTEDNDSSLLAIGNGGVFVMKSGAITGNNHVSDDANWIESGGVLVGGGGTFTMEGGRISGNRVTGQAVGGLGGGVEVYSGTFTMSGGEISGNSANGEEAAGGAIYVQQDSTFTMSGGTISGNSAISKNMSRGGGVYVSKSAVFTMSGGEIAGNIVKSEKNATGGGVTIWNNSEFTMSGGTISGNIANCDVDSSGGGVSLDSNSTFTMKGGTIYGSGAGANTNTAQENAALHLESGTAKWGMGGTYTKGGVPQTGGSNIDATDETMIAIPAP